MNESLSTPKTNTRFEIDEIEAERRLDELEPIARLGHLYSRVKRGTLMPDGTHETDGDHVVQLQLVALAYVTKYHPELDAGKLMIYLLLHDIIEAIVDDTPTIGLDEAGLQAKDEVEASGFAELEEICKDFPILIQFIHEYEQLKGPEAAMGKALDKLMPGYSHLHNKGEALRNLYGINSHEELVQATVASDARLAQYAEAFQDIIMMRTVLHRKVGRRAFGAVMLQSE